MVVVVVSDPIAIAPIDFSAVHRLNILVALVTLPNVSAGIDTMLPQPSNIWAALVTAGKVKPLGNNSNEKQSPNMTDAFVTDAVLKGCRTRKE